MSIRRGQAVAKKLIVNFGQNELVSEVDYVGLLQVFYKRAQMAGCEFQLSGAGRQTGKLKRKSYC